METGSEGEYVYSIERGRAGAGMRVWRWVVRHRDSSRALHQGTSIKSSDDARTAVLATITRLKQRSSVPSV